MAISRFITISFLLTLILGGGSAWLVSENFPQYNLYAIGGAWLVMFGITLAAYVFSYLGITRNEKQFVTLFLIGMGIKMGVGIISVLGVGLVRKSVLPEYVIAFFVSYFVLTTFEVYGLIRKLRAISNRRQ